MRCFCQMRLWNPLLSVSLSTEHTPAAICSPRDHAAMLSGDKCEDFLCAQLWNKVRVFMRLNKIESCPREAEKGACPFAHFSVRLRTRLLFLSQLIKSSNYRKFKSKDIRNPTFVDPILQCAPGVDKPRGVCSGEKTRTRFQRMHLRNARICPYAFCPAHGEGSMPKIGSLPQVLSRSGNAQAIFLGGLNTPCGFFLFAGSLLPFGLPYYESMAPDTFSL